MSYVKVTWRAGETALGPTNMNRMEDGIDEALTKANSATGDLTTLEGTVGTLQTTVGGHTTSIGNLQTDVAALKVDYITSKGTDSGWAYRKWHSGKVEAWYVGSVTFGSTTATGSLYYADATVTIPSGIFASAPEVIVSVKSGSSSDQLNAAVVSATGLASSATALTVRDYRISSATSQHSAYVRIYAWTN